MKPVTRNVTVSIICSPAFPMGAHDDDVDAFTQLLLRWHPRRMSPEMMRRLLRAGSGPLPPRRRLALVRGCGQAYVLHTVVPPVGLEFRIRSLNRGLGHHCVAPEF